MAVALRAGASIVYWPETQTDPDAYVGLARNLAAGHGFCTPDTTEPTAYRPPLYPLILAAGLLSLGWMQGGLIVLINLLCDLLTICSVGWWLSRGAGARHIPFVAMGILVCDPLALRYTALPMTELCFTALSTISILWLIDLLERSESAECSPPLWQWGLVGVLCGLTALCRPSIWPYWGLIFVVSVIRAICPNLNRVRCQQALVWFVTLGVTVSPWVLRNQRVFGHPILTTTHGGYTQWLGNNPVFFAEVARKPWGTVWSHDSLVAWQHENFQRMEADLGPETDEIAQDRWFATQARQAIQKDPAGFGWAMWYRVRSFWSVSPRGQASGNGWLGWWSTLWYVTLFVLAGYGICLRRGSRVSTGLLLLNIVMLQGVHLLYWTDTRMRLPIHPWLAIFAAIGLAGLPSARALFTNAKDALPGGSVTALGSRS
ncbi:hypothetical protein GC163_21785 [bacterium]|nr:hypothetical protein [bacterium]